MYYIQDRMGSCVSPNFMCIISQCYEWIFYQNQHKLLWCLFGTWLFATEDTELMCLDFWCGTLLTNSPALYPNECQVIHHKKLNELKGFTHTSHKNMTPHYARPSLEGASMCKCQKGCYDVTEWVTLAQDAPMTLSLLPRMLLSLTEKVLPVYRHWGRMLISCHAYSADAICMETNVVMYPWWGVQAVLSSVASWISRDCEVLKFLLCSGFQRLLVIRYRVTLYYMYYRCFADWVSFCYWAKRMPVGTSMYSSSAYSTSYWC